MRPTERQISELANLSNEALVTRALEAMHALNRRAKDVRDRKNAYRRARFADALIKEVDGIYELKNRFLDALVRAGMATVETFDVERSSRWVSCSSCDRSWVGDTWCYRCYDDTGVPEDEFETWYVICVEGYRFHQPEESASAAMVKVAVDVEPHDPDQPRREIPKVGLTIEAQHRCVEMAVERLLGEEVAA